MQAGKLRDRITFQKKTETNVLGVLTEDWSDVLTDIPAALETAGSREFRTEWKRNSESTVRFRIRFNVQLAADPAGAAAAYRILVPIEDSSPAESRIFDIFPPYDPDRKRRELIIEARETQ